MSSVWESLSGWLGDYGVPIYLGAQAASVLARKRGEKKVRAEQERLTALERERQRKLGDESRQAFNTTMPQVNAAAVEERRRAAEERIKQLNDPAASGQVFQNYSQASPDKPQVVQESIAGRLKESLSKGDDYMRRAALANSFGPAMAGGARAIDESARRIGSIGRSAERSTAILPYELDKAQDKGRRYRTLHDVLGGAGQLAGLYGLTRQPRRPAPRSAPTSIADAFER
jgi:hypothetical protein